MCSLFNKLAPLWLALYPPLVYVVNVVTFGHAPLISVYTFIIRTLINTNNTIQVIALHCTLHDEIHCNKNGSVQAFFQL